MSTKAKVVVLRGAGATRRAERVSSVEEALPEASSHSCAVPHTMARTHSEVHPLHRSQVSHTETLVGGWYNPVPVVAIAVQAL